MSKEDVFLSLSLKHTQEYYSVIKKNEFLPFAAKWMELETLILSEVIQKEKDKYHMISLISRT